MSINAKSLGIDQLSVADRMALVEEIWDSIVEEGDSLELPASHLEEIDRRLEAREANPDGGSTWEEVKGRLMSTPKADQ